MISMQRQNAFVQLFILLSWKQSISVMKAELNIKVSFTPDKSPVLIATERSIIR